MVTDITKRVTTCEGGAGAGCYAGSGESVAILVHGAGKPVRCADIGGALPIGDLSQGTTVGMAQWAPMAKRASGPSLRSLVPAGAASRRALPVGT